jgi:hypothetical protein
MAQVPHHHDSRAVYRSAFRVNWQMHNVIGGERKPDCR